MWNLKFIREILRCLVSLSICLVIIFFIIYCTVVFDKYSKVDCNFDSSIISYNKNIYELSGRYWVYKLDNDKIILLQPKIIDSSDNITVLQELQNTTFYNNSLHTCYEKYYKLKVNEPNYRQKGKIYSSLLFIFTVLEFMCLFLLDHVKKLIKQQENLLLA